MSQKNINVPLLYKKAILLPKIELYTASYKVETL
jgi:hypothetical protein